MDVNQMIRMSTDETLWHCGCEGGKPAGGPGIDWCTIRKAATLNWDITPSIMTFIAAPAEEIAQCPLGTFFMLTALMMSDVLQGTRENDIVALRWLEEAFSFLMGGEEMRGTNVLPLWFTSGWNPFLMFSQVRRQKWFFDTRLNLIGETDCAPPGVTDNFLQLTTNMFSGGDVVPIPALSAFMVSIKGSPCSAKDPAAGCCIARMLAQLALADTVHVAGKVSEWKGVLATARQQLADLHDALRAARKQDALLITLLQTTWPVLEVMDRLHQLPWITIHLERGIRRYLLKEPEGPFVNDKVTFRQRLFPRREIASDNVRYVRQPFCGMRPFEMFVEKIAVAAAAKADGQSKTFQFFEGGPHMGDCTLWCTAALLAGGVTPYTVALEPLPDAAGFFRESVAANGWEGYNLVVPKAMAATDGGSVHLTYFPGHNGQGTTMRAMNESLCGEKCIGYTDVPAVSLDSTWTRHGPVEILKLSVNGEELNALRGSRNLLTKRRVCTVLLHIFKAQRGWTDSKDNSSPVERQKLTPQQYQERYPSSAEMWNLLHNVGGLELGLFLDISVPPPPNFTDRRPRPSLTTLTSVDDMHEVFDDENTDHNFLVAWQKNPPPESPCARSLALEQWHNTFGNPLTTPYRMLRARTE